VPRPRVDAGRKPDKRRPERPGSSRHRTCFQVSRARVVLRGNRLFGGVHPTLDLRWRGFDPTDIGTGRARLFVSRPALAHVRGARIGA
jgi:hypothetical protein